LIKKIQQNQCRNTSVPKSECVFLAAGVLTFVDGGRGAGGGCQEGLFESNQLVRRETSQGALQRAQGVAAKARALAK
jgi:hypothetical protein